MEEVGLSIVNNEKSIFSHNDIKYTEDQIGALNLVGNTISKHSGSKELIISGFAGTGKTTILYNMFMYARYINKFKDIYVLAPTNKAIVVLKSKLAIKETYFSTLHSILYGSPDKKGKWIPSKEIYNACLFIDEASMISADVLRDIRKSFKNCLIIFLGDGYQLEPVGVDPKILKNPDFLLQEVMRNAGDILNYSIEIRNAKKIVQPTNFPTISVNGFDNIIQPYIEKVRKKEDVIILVADNNTRIKVNTRVRTQLFPFNIINVDERLIALNNSPFFANGETFNVEDVSIYRQEIVEFVDYNQNKSEELIIVCKLNNQTMLLLPNIKSPSFHSKQFSCIDYDVLEKLVGVDNITFDESGRYHSLNNNIVICTYAYAISVHKSQGSQWEEVFVNVPSYKPKWEEGRWFYTAVTRASKKLTIVI